MLAMIIGNIDFSGAVVMIGFFISLTVIGCVYLTRKRPQDYKLEELRINQTLISHRRD